MPKAKNAINRRQFLHNAGCAAMGYTTLLSSLVSFRSLNAAVASNTSLDGDYKALVCISLSGGNDAFNMLVPRGTSEYQEYAGVRGNLAIANSALLPITPATSDGKQYGLHPSMPNVQSLFAQGKLAMVVNVGSLIEHISSNTEFTSGLKKLPLGLYSHDDQLAHWQTAIPQDRGAVGWGGRLADLIMDMNTNQDISMNISLSGVNLFQTGQFIFPYTIQNFGTGSVGLDGYEGNALYQRVRRAAVDSLMDYHYMDVFRNAYSNTLLTAQQNHGAFSTAIGNLPPLNTAFSSTKLSQNLNMVARTIAIRNQLEVSRQIFFVEYHGWDHHSGLLGGQADKLNVLDNALSEFQTAMEELNLSDQVTTFTISDFARTLTSNGNGSDHAWGGTAMVMGGAVNGGDFYGTYPVLGLNNSLDLGGGVLIPTLAADEYFAELALWYGISPTDLPIVLPNITNFYTPGSGSPVGFMQT